MTAPSERALSRPAVIPRASAIECPGCGGAVQLRTFGHAVTVVCESCGSVLDPRGDVVKLLEAGARYARQPPIPLGTRGTWRGHACEVIGWQRREITVEGTHYPWDELLLFNPYRGFRYLTVYEGHWNDVVTLSRLPTMSKEGDRPAATLDGKRFKHFQHANATTVAVLGEFPWEVRRSDRAAVDDFVAPPMMLSREMSYDETTWSLGEYVDGDRVWNAFKQKGSPPSRTGIFANQPNRASRLAVSLILPTLAAVVAAVVLGIGQNAMAANDRIFSATYQATPTQREPFVTDEFTVRRNGHLAIRVRADGIHQNWLALNVSLINAVDGAARDMGAEVSYYEGYDEGERWTEGRRRNAVVLPTVPAGRYYLRIEPELGQAAVTYGVEVVSDVPLWRYVGFAMLLLSLPLILVAFRAFAFESGRWQESDYPWSSSEDDE